MKTTMTAALALVLLASTAGAALAQDQGGRGGGRHDGGGRQEGGGRDGGQRGGGQREGGGQRPQFRDTERRDMMGGQDNRGQRRSEFQADQRPAAQPRAAPQARPAPAAPAAVQAPQVRERSQFRGGDGGQNRANRDFGAQQRDGSRGAEGARDNNRRGDGVRGDGNRGDGARDGRRDNDRRDGDRGRGSDGGDWNRGGGDRYRGGDHRDDRGRPHWQQGRYPPVYRSHQRYRYGYYRPPIGFYSHSWAFGEFLPLGWYGSQYLLNDWWSYDLPFPPPGYDWVRVGDDALLIDSYSGRVVQVVRDIFW